MAALERRRAAALAARSSLGARKVTGVTTTAETRHCCTARQETCGNLPAARLLQLRVRRPSAGKSICLWRAWASYRRMDGGGLRRWARRKSSKGWATLCHGRRHGVKAQRGMRRYRSMRNAVSSPRQGEKADRGGRGGMEKEDTAAQMGRSLAPSGKSNKLEKRQLCELRWRLAAAGGQRRQRKRHQTRRAAWRISRAGVTPSGRLGRRRWKGRRNRIFRRKMVTRARALPGVISSAVKEERRLVRRGARKTAAALATLA